MVSAWAVLVWKKAAGLSWKLTPARHSEKVALPCSTIGLGIASAASGSLLEPQARRCSDDDLKNPCCMPRQPSFASPSVPSISRGLCARRHLGRQPGSRAAVLQQKSKRRLLQVGATTMQMFLCSTRRYCRVPAACTAGRSRQGERSQGSGSKVNVPLLETKGALLPSNARCVQRTSRNPIKTLLGSEQLMTAECILLT